MRPGAGLGAGLGAGILLCAGVTGCSLVGGDGGGEKDLKGAGAPSAVHGEAVRAAVARTSRGTARVVERVDVGDGEKTYTLTVTGRFDFAAGNGRLEVDFPGGAVDHVEERFVGDTVYVSPLAEADGAWAAVPRDEAKAHAALRAPLNDPEHVLRQVAAARKVSREGGATVGGRRTTHYRGTLDHATATLRLDERTKRTATKMRELLEGDLPVYADTWVDGQGRLVRARLSFYGGSLHSSVTLDLPGQGEPMKPVTRPTGEVTAVRPPSGVLLG
ncbi:hypothetical protein ACQB60_11440 [Actinomycetota bacterium Odt1-20B]